MNFARVVQNLPLGFFIPFIIFLVLCIFELIFAFREMEKHRIIVKPFLMLSLAISSFFALPDNTFMVIALICAMIGDILVVLPDKKLFSIGVLFFFAGHVLYILEVILHCMKGQLSLSQIIVLISVFVVIFISSFMFIFRKIAKNIPEGLGMSLYFGTLFSVLSTMCIATSGFGYFMWLTIIGSVCFIISDCLLMYFKYGKKPKRHHFYIMLTYLLAQSLIVVGFVLSFTAATL